MIRPSEKGFSDGLIILGNFKMRPLQNSFLSQTAETQTKIFGCLGEKGILQRSQFVKTAKQVEIDAGDEAVFEFGIGEAVPLSEQDGFEHGQQGIGGTAAVVSEVTGFLTIQVLFDRLPINHLIQLQ